MRHPVTVLAPIKLAAGKTEADLIAASDSFQQDFVSQTTGIIRRELICIGKERYLDIVQFESREDALRIMAEEAESQICQDFFSVMDLTEMDDEIEFHPSLKTYG